MCIVRVSLAQARTSFAVRCDRLFENSYDRLSLCAAFVIGQSIFFDSRRRYYAGEFMAPMMPKINLPENELHIRRCWVTHTAHTHTRSAFEYSFSEANSTKNYFASIHTYVWRAIKRRTQWCGECASANGSRVSISHLLCMCCCAYARHTRGMCAREHTPARYMCLLQFYYYSSHFEAELNRIFIILKMVMAILYGKYCAGIRPSSIAFGLTVIVNISHHFYVEWPTAVWVTRSPIHQS